MANLLKKIASYYFSLLLSFTVETELSPSLFDHLHRFFCKLPSHDAAHCSPGHPTHGHFCVCRISALSDEGHAYFSQLTVCPVFVLWEFSFETLTLQVEIDPPEAVTIELPG